jgi:TatA/E family protein of Tat protein translocase
MAFVPLLAFIDAPIIIGILVVGALLFGADKLPKIARSAGQAKKEFMMGQIEADEAAAKAREEARMRAETKNADVMDNVEAGSMSGEAIPQPTPGKGTPSS